MGYIQAEYRKLNKKSNKNLSISCKCWIYSFIAYNIDFAVPPGQEEYTKKSCPPTT